jgi:excisionase family DNA binding protein
LGEAFAARLSEADDTFITSPEAASLARVSLPTIRQWVQNLQIGHLVPHSRIYLISKTKLENLLAARRPGFVSEDFSSFPETNPEE